MKRTEIETIATENCADPVELPTNDIVSVAPTETAKDESH